MYKNVIFDLYGTLVNSNYYEYKSGLWDSMARFYSYFDANYSPEELRDLYFIEARSFIKHNMKTKYPDIKIEDVFKKLYTFQDIIPSYELIATTAVMFRVLSTNYISLYNGVIEVLETLKARKKNLYLLSNGQRIFSIPELKQLNIHDYFDNIYFSSDIGICKPDKQIFSHIVKKEGLNIRRTIMIGNDATTDIAGANGIHMDSILISDNVNRYSGIKYTHCVPYAKFEQIIELV